MKFIDSSNCHQFYDRNIPPAVVVSPGEKVALKTIDAGYGEIRDVQSLLAHKQRKDIAGDPLTGPVYVEGAQPGNTLVAEILDIELDTLGFQLIGPNRGIIRDEVPEWEHYPVRIEGNRLVLPYGMELPICPVIGSVGTAPAGDPTNLPNPHGGNLDAPEITIATKVYLPVGVEGALFFLGDVHARQGDGEIVGAPEIGAKVTVRFEVLEERHATWPMAESSTHWYMFTAGPTTSEAMRTGVLETAHFVANRYGIRLSDALILMTMCIRLTSSRLQWEGLEPVTCVAFEKALLENATRNYKRPTNP